MESTFHKRKIKSLKKGNTKLQDLIFAKISTIVKKKHFQMKCF
ncbi:hypothetical protein FCR2A7T_09690 [Flavobacterium cauense R2A-7]|nr:hypothetical protein FCR2A7T_09690 [Flavobacterium cauense R2A-7]